jgi:hypothetical protein
LDAASPCKKNKAQQHPPSSSRAQRSTSSICRTKPLYLSFNPKKTRESLSTSDLKTHHRWDVNGITDSCSPNPHVSPTFAAVGFIEPLKAQDNVCKLRNSGSLASPS